MPANYTIDNTNQLVNTVWEGEANDIELIEAMKTYRKAVQSNPDYLNYNEIVNLNKITKFNLTAEGISTIAEIASTAEKSENYKKLALIANSELAYGLARMYETYRSLPNESNKNIRVFKNENDALEWIHE